MNHVITRYTKIDWQYVRLLVLKIMCLTTSMYCNVPIVWLIQRLRHVVDAAGGETHGDVIGVRIARPGHHDVTLVTALTIVPGT